LPDGTEEPAVIGQTLSHYRIVEKLGEGGMGVVYRAEDTRLRRTVALKFLPPRLAGSESDKHRFLMEARAASSLNHANISHIYEIDEADGETFIAMEFVEGQSLRQLIRSGPMKMGDLLKVAIQVAAGLQSAHRRGIVHRDIKPENVIMTTDGVAKIVDFGLARAAEGSTDSTSQSIYGSMAYMSPEQIRGEQACFSMDIWSFGVVLYEMVTGQVPFRGEYEQMVSYAILNEQHALVSGLRSDTPVSLGEIIDRCLEKEPSERFRGMDEIMDELKRLERDLLHGPAKGPGKSIAVLPFKDINTDDREHYLGEGLTDEIITNLSKLRQLKVVSRTSVMMYDRSGKSMRQIAGDLGVQYLLEGSVRKHGDNLRITAQLIDAAQDSYLWAETYPGVLKDVFDIQEKVAARIVRALKVRLTPAERKTLRKRFTENTEAYQLYLQGRYFWNKRSEEGLRTAIRYFEKAIERDPSYALAWAGMADSYSLLGEYGKTARKELFPLAQAAVEKALEIDSRLAEVHTSYASLLMLHKWDWVNSQKEFKLAIGLNPNYATAHHWYSQWLLSMGRLDEALEAVSRAIDLDPVSQAILKDKGLVLYYSRQYDRAIETTQRTLELDAAYSSAYRLLSLAYQGKRMFDEAIAENERWGEFTGNQVETLISQAQIQAAAGRREDALGIVRRVREENLMSDNMCRGLGLTFAALGGVDTAFEWLEESYNRREESLLSLKVDPKADHLRRDPRFSLLLRRIGVE
jgi:serine/threonine-protein kinase